MRTITISELLGMRVHRILRTPLQLYPGDPDMWCCSTFVEIKPGTVFQVCWNEAFATGGNVQLLDVSPDLIPAPFDANGERIIGIFESDLWPSIGVLLSSFRVLVDTVNWDGVESSLFDWASVRDEFRSMI